jgi:hypothetical protein
MNDDGQLATASCTCGQVSFALSGAPIMHVECYCTSCRTAGRAFEQAPGAPRVVTDDGGTDFVLYRKDRARLVTGGDRLREHRLKPDSPTRRMVAACCDTPVLLEFASGHWVSFYRGRLPGDVPPLQERTMTIDRPAGVTLPDDVPNSRRQSAKFMWRLFTAWAAMGFRVPKVPW